MYSYDRSSVADALSPKGQLVEKLAADGTEADDDVDLEFGELQVAEYIVFLLALDTYMRYLDEAAGEDAPPDVMTVKGLRLLRSADRLHLDNIDAFLRMHLPSDLHKKMLAKALRMRPTPDGASRRAFQIRTLMSRGGAPTMRAVFQTNKALKAVRDAISASMVQNADTALDQFAVIQMRNVKLRDWIDNAAKQAGSGEPPTPVTAAAATGVDGARDLLEQKIKQEGSSPTSTESNDALQKQDVILDTVREEATEAAKKSLEASGEEDAPPKKSEVVGLATAAAVAAMSDPGDLRNVPEALRTLDPEQRAAALTNGKVLVAAGAGAGKSTTLISRMKYLIQEKNASPRRIFAASFNRLAADELRAKAVASIGPAAESISIGTMHSLFRRMIRDFGTPEEALVVSDTRLMTDSREKKQPGREFVVDGEAEAPTRGSKAPQPMQITFAIKGILKDCGGPGLAALTGLPPKTAEMIAKKGFSKGCKKLMENWRGNGIDFKTARQGATTVEELQASVWYELYLGLKGDLGPTWRPPCDSGTFTRYVGKFGLRREKQAPLLVRYGDGDDMIRIFRDILKRDPKARAEVQRMYDHVLVDEAQDLNIVQHEIFEMMADGFEGREDKSLWMVGDDKQAIYQFRGARPSLFSGMDGKPGWTRRLIQTNYRCEPEIVDAANRIAANNENQIQMTCRANPTKPEGRASIDVVAPGDYTDGAFSTFQEFEKEIALGKSPKDFAVLSRTNAELNAFEDQCILRELPYTRKKGSGFLESPETSTVLGYMDLAMSSDNEELLAALKATLMRPNRDLYLSQEALDTIIEDAVKFLAQDRGTDKRDISPLDFLTSRREAMKLARMLKMPFREKMVAAAKRLEAQRGHEAWLQQRMRQGGGIEWMFNQAVDQLAEHLMDMGQQIASIRQAVRAGAKTNDVLNMILDRVKATPKGYVKRGEAPPKSTSLRDQIREDRSFNRDPEEDDEEVAPQKVTIDENGMKVEQPEDQEKEPENQDPLAGLGAVRYLFQLAEPNEKDHALGVDPTNGRDFYRKIDRYKQVSKDLQDPKKHAERVTLSTIHSVKGAEWENVALCMSYGFFPAVRRDEVDLLSTAFASNKEVDPRDPTVALEARAKLDGIKEDPMTADRNLAYVGVTRAKEKLKIICSQERVPPKLKQSGQPVLGKFALEAGFAPGENVKRPGAGVNPLDAIPSTPEPELTPEEGLRLASLDPVLASVFPFEDLEVVGYDYERA